MHKFARFLPLHGPQLQVAQCRHRKTDPIFCKNLAHREARARRSNKMGRVLFYVFLICASATLRLYPEMAEYVVLNTENTQQKNLQPSKRHL